MNQEDNDFIKLLEEYLNEEEIELKKREDSIESIRKYTQIVSESSFDESITIPIKKFVNDYLGISASCDDLYHSGLKELNLDYVIGIDNNFANKNPEYVYNGFLLLVIDSRGKRGTYLNPIYLNKLVHDDELQGRVSQFMKKHENNLRMLNMFFSEYVQLLEELETNERFYEILKETHKLHKLKILRIKEGVIL